MLAGNIITLINLTLFTGLTTYYTIILLRLGRRRGQTSTHPYPSTTSDPGLISHTPLTLLFISLALLFTRTIYRTTAYSKGLVDKHSSVYPLRSIPLYKENWSYAFDALMVFVLIVVWAAWFPTRARLGEEDDEEEEVVGTGGAGGRRWSRLRFPGLGRWFGRRKERGVNVRMEGFLRA